MEQTIQWYLERVEKVRGTQEEAEALIDLSRALMEDMQFADAMSYLEKALALSRLQQNKTNQRDIHGLMAIAGVNLQNLETSMDHVQQAIALSRDDYEHLLEHFATLMIVLIMTPPDSPEHTYAEELVEELRQRGTEDVVIHQMVQMMAETYGMTGNAERAIGILEAEVERTEDNKWFPLMQLGSMEIALGQFNDGYRHLKEARQIASDQNDKEAEIVILLGLGAACVDSDRFENGIRFLKSALKLTRELNDSVMEQVTLSELGNAYAYNEDYDEALETYKELIDSARASQDKEAEMMGWANTGNVYRDTDQPSKAIDAYEQALTLSRDLDNLFEQAEVLIQLGQAYAQSGALEKGVKLMERAIPLYTQMNEEIEAGDTYLTIAELYADHDRIPKAMEYARKARQIFAEFELADLIGLVDEFIEDLE